MIKNFLFVLNRFKTSSLLNIAGLSLAFTVFAIILIQVKFEYGYEKCHTNADRIYRVDMTDAATGDEWAMHVRPFTDVFINSSPDILAGTLINPFIGDFYITVERGGKQQGYKESFGTCFADITKVFSFQMVEGKSDCLENPENAIIPQSMAKKMFGSESAVGKQITLMGNMWTKQNGGTLNIGGVYRDFPENTQLKNLIYTAMNPQYAINDWASQNYFLYVLIDKNANPEKVADSFNRSFDFSLLSRPTAKLAVKLIPLKSIYFRNEDPSQGLVRSGDSNFPFIMLSIGILLIAIAIINYTNFNMALAPMRIRSINTRKILGSSDFSLRLELVSEGVLMSLLAYAISVFLLYFAYYRKDILPLKIDLNPHNNLDVMASVFFVALLTGIIASLRPAFYMTSFPPIMAMKGSFGLSPSGKRLRSLLIGFQFFVSISLIIIAFFMYRQNEFMQHYNLGYNKEHIVLTEIPHQLAYDRQPLIAKLKENPDIEDVAFSWAKLNSSDTYSQYGMSYKGEVIGCYQIDISWNLPKVLGITLAEGRMPEESDETGKLPVFLINKTMQKNNNIKAGDFINYGWENSGAGSYQVIGVINNIKFRSLRNGDDNLTLVVNSKTNNLLKISYVRLRAGADIKQALQYIEKSIHEFDPTYPVKSEFADDLFNSLYQKELNIEKTIGLFSLLAIIISIAGVFGLVMYESQFRRKEISIRKVAGSTEGEILAIFNRNYLLIFVVSFLLAVPTSYFILHRWLNNFAYSSGLSLWGFLLAGLAVMAVVAATVSVQSYRAATENPVKALNIN